MLNWPKRVHIERKVNNKNEKRLARFSTIFFRFHSSGTFEVLSCCEQENIGGLPECQRFPVAHNQHVFHTVKRLRVEV